ncbi:hypothetical protein GBF38_002602, partial [Nibea albiflora]
MSKDGEGEKSDRVVQKKRRKHKERKKEKRQIVLLHVYMKKEQHADGKKWKIKVCEDESGTDDDEKFIQISHDTTDSSCKDNTGMNEAWKVS